MARDITSHAVVSISPDKVNDYYARRKIAESQQKEIDVLKEDIQQIKSMLQALLQR